MAAVLVSRKESRAPAVRSERHGKQAMRCEIVEISSDEESEIDDGQPESSKHTGLKRAPAQDDFQDWFAELDVINNFFEANRPKRQKLDNEDSIAVDRATLPAQELANPSASNDLRLEVDYVDIEPAQALINLDDPGWAFPVLPLRPNVKPEDTLGKVDNATNPQPSVEPQHPKRKRSKQATLAPTPYYDDGNFGIRMYCGPGYEQFPIALGTVAEHQHICDRWDEQQLKRATESGDETIDTSNNGDVHNHDNLATDSSEDEDDVGNFRKPNRLETQCFDHVLEILPDLQHEFLLSKIRAHMEGWEHIADEEVQMRPNIENIVSDLLELPEYPKQSKTTDVCIPAADGTGVTIQWSKGGGHGKTYQGDALRILAAHFTHIPTHFIHKTVCEKKSLFDSYRHIYDLETKYGDTPSNQRSYRRMTDPRRELEKKYISKSHGHGFGDEWKSLVNELQAAKQQVKRDELREAREKQHEADEAANLEQHRSNGTLVECQCCFDDETALNRAISCESPELHWFCFSCIKRLAENQVGSMKHEMNCMDGSGCKALLPEKLIRLAVPAKLLDKLAFFKQQFEIAAAGIEGLEQCPFCDFKAICDPLEDDSTFRCQNADCRRISCRICHEDNHRPKSCEEAKTDKGLSARHQIEEARSEAMIRPCPRCKVKIIKELGCNKMICTNCRCVMCYVCKADISNKKDGGYEHFNARGSACALYDKGRNRHEQEADAAEEEAIRKVREANGDIDEKQLQIETGKAKKLHARDEPKRDRHWRNRHANAQRHRRMAHQFANIPPPPAGVPPAFPDIAELMGRFDARLPLDLIQQYQAQQVQIPHFDHFQAIPRVEEMGHSNHDRNLNRMNAPAQRMEQNLLDGQFARDTTNFEIPHHHHHQQRQQYHHPHPHHRNQQQQQQQAQDPNAPQLDWLNGDGRDARASISFNIGNQMWPQTTLYQTQNHPGASDSPQPAGPWNATNFPVSHTFVYAYPEIPEHNEANNSLGINDVNMEYYAYPHLNTTINNNAQNSSNNDQGHMMHHGLLQGAVTDYQNTGAGIL